MKKIISVVTPCYNEEDNIEELYQQVKAIFTEHNYNYEHIFIDNASEDRTVSILKKIATTDLNVKIIVNSRNFGHIRSPIHALFQAKGDAAILMAADLEDPPSLIVSFLRKWEEGYKVVKAVKTSSKENPVMYSIRKFFYYLMGQLSEIELTRNYHGYGLYDRVIVDALKDMGDPYPYFRGLITEIGFEHAVVEYPKPVRPRGITKNNFYSLYDIAMLGVVNHSKIPLRVATIAGFLMSGLSLLAAFVYLVIKFLFWNLFPAGTIPIIVAVFFFSSLQLFFIGILGEYIGFIYTQVQKRPLVIEKERINFE